MAISRFDASTIMQLRLISLGYTGLEKGCCAGFTRTWLKYLLGGWEQSFFYLLEFSDSTRDIDLRMMKNIIDQKAVWKIPLTRYELIIQRLINIIDLIGYFQTIVSFPFQEMNYSARELLFHSRSNNIYNEVQIYSEPVIFSNPELINFFSALSVVMKSLSNEAHPIGMCITTDKHEMGLRYVHSNNYGHKWILVNIPGYNEIGHEQLFSRLHQGFVDVYEDKMQYLYLSFNIALFTNKSHPQLETLKEMLMEFRQLRLNQLTVDIVQRTAQHKLTLDYLAIAENHLDFFQKIFSLLPKEEHSIRLNRLFSNQYNLIRLACLLGHLEGIKCLISLGAKYDYVDIVSLAAKHGHAEIVDYFITIHLGICQSNTHEKLFLYATANHHWKMITQLFKSIKLLTENEKRWLLTIRNNPSFKEHVATLPLNEQQEIYNVMYPQLLGMKRIFIRHHPFLINHQPHNADILLDITESESSNIKKSKSA